MICELIPYELGGAVDISCAEPAYYDAGPPRYYVDGIEYRPARHHRRHYHRHRAQRPRCDEYEWSRACEREYRRERRYRDED